MKAFAIILLLSSSARSQQFGDDNPSGKWLVVSDGYVWPAAAVKAPGFIPRWRKFADLDAAQRKAIAGHWPDEKAPERVEVAEADLNGDGRLELFVGIPIYSGTGGTFYTILSTTDGKTYAGIGDIQGWGFKFLVRKNGWFQVEGMSRGGGGNYTRCLLTFVGEGYVITRNEGHDFNAGRVTIRETRSARRAGEKPADRSDPK